MANKLTGADIDKWYRGLNVARTQSGIGMTSLSEGSFSKKQTSQRVIALLNNISSSRSANTFLNMSDYSVNSGNFDPKDKIWEVDRETIDKAIVSLLRVCYNVSCRTVCNNTGANTNQLHTNTDCNNGIQSNQFVETPNINGPCSNVSQANGTCYFGTQNATNGTDGDGDGTIDVWQESCWNGTLNNGTHSNAMCTNGTQWNTTLNNGLHINGKNSHGTKTNGNTNAIYDPNTATYSAKNGYTEEQAKNRY